MQTNVTTSSSYYLQTQSTAKHFFVFNFASGVEASDVQVSLADLRLSYLAAFKHLVQAGVQSVRSTQSHHRPVSMGNTT